MKLRWIIGLVVVPSMAASHPGNGIIAISANAVITGDAIHNGVWLFEKGKAPVKMTGETRFHCHWVTSGKGGSIYFETLSERSGRWTETVYRMDTLGAHPDEVASGVEGTFGIFAVGSAGELIAQSGSRIVSWKDGRNSAFRGSGSVAPGDPALGNVHAFAWGPDNVLYLADGSHVRRVGADGVVRTVATIGGKVTYPLYAGQNSSVQIWGLAVDTQGRIFAAVPSNGQVVRVDKDKSQHVVCKSEDGWQATGVAVFGDNVFLLESKTLANSNFGPRVRVMRKAGNIEALGTAS